MHYQWKQPMRVERSRPAPDRYRRRASKRRRRQARESRHHWFGGGGGGDPLTPPRLRPLLAVAGPAGIRLRAVVWPDAGPGRAGPQGWRVGPCVPSVTDAGPVTQRIKKVEVMYILI